MTTTCFIIFLFIIFLIICSSTCKDSYLNGGKINDCPPGYVVARCMGPNGERVCTPLLKEFR